MHVIARIWHGWAPRATAEDYERHCESEVSEHLQAVDGFRGARLLRWEDELRAAAPAVAPPREIQAQQAIITIPARQ